MAGRKTDAVTSRDARWFDESHGNDDVQVSPNMSGIIVGRAWRTLDTEIRHAVEWPSPSGMPPNVGALIVRFDMDQHVGNC